MPPRVNSRHALCDAYVDDGGNLVLTDREPWRWRPREDTIEHVVNEGETLYSLAGRYFAPIKRASGLWWILCDFQPEPIVDPTVTLTVGRVIYIPSMRAVQDEIFSERRRGEIVEEV